MSIAHSLIPAPDLLHTVHPGDTWTLAQQEDIAQASIDQGITLERADFRDDEWLGIVGFWLTIKERQNLTNEEVMGYASTAELASEYPRAEAQGKLQRR